MTLVSRARGLAVTRTGQRSRSADVDIACMDLTHTAPGDEPDAVMHLLSDGVPISLLADLTDPQGPYSGEILAIEGQPDGAWWERAEPVARARR